MSTYIIYDFHKKDIKKINDNNSFLAQYKDFKKLYDDYEKGITPNLKKQNNPEYTEIDNIENKNIFSKINIYNKEKINEVA